MKNPFRKAAEFAGGNWGLKLLSLVLAIVIYHAMKSESARSAAGGEGNGRTIFGS